MTVATAPLADSTRTFLRRHAPFDAMADDALEWLLPRLTLAYFPKDATILSPASGPVSELCIIQRGRVGSRPDDPRAEPDATLGPGELFPVGALSAAGPTTKIFHALQDTFCYMLPRDDFMSLRARSPELERYCTQAITETLKASLAQLAVQYGQRAAEQQTLTRPLRELVRRAPVTAVAATPLREVLLAMEEAKVRTVVVTDDERRPVGLFTLVDLLRRVALADRPLTAPVADVMTAPPVTLEADASAHEAMHVMAERGIRQVVVVDAGRVVGVVNERDLFALQRVSMRQVIEVLRGAESIADLARGAEDIRGLTRNLLAQGVGAEPLTRTIASLNDGLVRRAIDLVAARHDLAGLDWCWLALGSEGRSEQTLATDQDNAIVFADAGDPDSCRHELLPFARQVNQALDRCGFALCRGEVMAGNPKLCLSLREWQQRFARWIDEPDPQALLNATIFFDFRPIHGDHAVSARLRTWLAAYASDRGRFLLPMARNALENQPPLGLVRDFVLADGGEHPGTVDLKVNGVQPFVETARIYALATGETATNTLERLAALVQTRKLSPIDVEGWAEAFRFLQLVRLRLNAAQRKRGEPLHNHVDPAMLNDLERRILKEAFRQARKLQARLTRDFAVTGATFGA